MTYPLVRLVAAPDPAAAVRYDFNDSTATATRRVEADFTLGAPTLEGDPTAIGQTWGFRSPSFTQQVKGSKAAALATLSALARELLRPTNWLMVQLDAVTPPVFLKTYRSGYEALSLAEVYVDTKDGDPVKVKDTWRIQVPFLAEAFGFLERVAIPPVTVTQTPTGPNAMQAVLPRIEGDAPTALRVSVTPETGAVAQDGSHWLIGCIAGTAEMTTALLDVSAMTPVLETGGVVTAAGYFENSHRVTTLVNSNHGLRPVLSGALPVLPRGIYKMELRCEADGVADLDKTFRFRVFFIDGGDGSFSQTVSLTIPGTPVPGHFRGWVDLGEISVPFGVGSALPDDVTLAAPPVNFAIQMGSDDDTGVIRTDTLRLIPVDGLTVDSATLLNSDLGSWPFQGDTTGNWDGDDETYWISEDDSLVSGQASMAGGFPVADPAAEQNLLIVMATSKGNGVLTGTHEITYPGAAATVEVSYHPRILHLPGGK